MEELNIFLNKYPIVFVVVPIGVDVNKLTSFIVSNFGSEINQSVGIPKENNKDTLLVVCDNNDFFSEIHESRFLLNNYDKFPSKMIVILPIMKMMFMNDPLAEIQKLKSYKIPILLSRIFDIFGDINIKVLKNKNDKANNFTIIAEGQEIDINDLHEVMEILELLDTSSKIDVIITYNSNKEDEINDLVMNIIKIKSFVTYLSNTESKHLDYFENKIVVK